MKIAGTKKEIYEWIRKFIEKNFYSPTYREIANALDISSLSVVKYHVDTLAEIGAISVIPRKPRGIRIENLSSELKVEQVKEIMKTQAPRIVRRVALARYVKMNSLTYFGGCAYCLSNDEIQYDHFLPVSMGGCHDAENIVPACKKCNQKKSDYEPVKWVIDNFGIDRLQEIIFYLLSVHKIQ